MDNYKQILRKEVGEEKKEPWDIHVKSGSKMRNVISHSLRLLQTKKMEKIILTGSGPTVTKTITCAEIVKRKVKGLYQLNKLFYTSVDDEWEPKQEGLDMLKVTRRVPSIRITLSTVLLDPNEAGYQAPGEFTSPVEFNSNDFELSKDNPTAGRGRGRRNYGSQRRTRGGGKKGKSQDSAFKDQSAKDSGEREQLVGESPRNGPETKKHQRHYGKWESHPGGPKTKTPKRTIQDVETASK